MPPDPPLSLKQVRAITVIANMHSLARAAEHLNTSQSSLSRFVGEAERRLGARLFERGWTGMEPTSHGEVAIAHATRMVSAIAGAELALRRHGEPAPNLRAYVTWPLLRIVDAVCATGGGSAAAGYLGISQPQVSRALSTLSAAVGRPVFERHPTGLRATEVAILLASLHNTLLAEITALPDRLGALCDQVTGRVAIGMLPFSEQDLVARAFGTMVNRHRHVRLLAVTGAYAALTDALRRRELDFVIGTLRDPSPHEDLQEIALFDEAFAVVARAGHPLTRRPWTVADLAKESWVVAPHGTPTRSYFEDLLIASGVVPPAQTCEIVTFNLAEQMILHSDTIGLLTYSPFRRRSLRAGLTILPVDLPDSRRRIGLTMRKAGGPAPAHQLFLDVLREVISSLRNPATHDHKT